VPFRLTQNLVDAMGVTGYDGVFRKAGEVTMRLLRANTDTLMSVLESFIHDPLVEWNRKKVWPAKYWRSDYRNLDRKVTMTKQEKR
jgi:phosphatidylinositol kinase/protein kinase (PI-3  family)